MTANRYTNVQNDLSEWEQCLDNGTLFDAYQYHLGTYSSGALKMIVFSNFKGMLGVHCCYFCNAWKMVPPYFARIGHFRRRVDDGRLQHNSFFTRYTQRFQQEIAFLKGKSISRTL